LIPESIPPAYAAWRTGTKYDDSICVTGPRLAESIPWNRFLGSLNVYKFGVRAQHFLARFAGEGMEGGPGTRF
jgi:hypothetical protein